MIAKAGHQGQGIGNARIAQSNPNGAIFRAHLQEILQSAPFKASRRSFEFLQHIVEKALSGHFEDLKERSLGVDLFGRSATYDTGADAIVRVTASDVRRRLQQYYSEEGTLSEYRIELPSGSYVPEFRKSLVPAEQSPSSLTETARETPHDPVNNRNRLYYAILFILLAGSLGFSGWTWNKYSKAVHLDSSEALPWSALLSPDKDLRIIFCDPDISLSQGLLGFHISLSDYANQRYQPEELAQLPLAQQIAKAHRGTNVASIDAKIAVNLASMAQSRSRAVKTHTARSLHILDFKTEDNFVILGSPRSNPWMDLFQDQLNFRFEYDAASEQEVIRNHRMESGESSVYVPTAKGWATGDAYALVAFVPNPNHQGDVLLLAGSNAEATEAAGKFILDRDLMSRTLQEHKIDPKGKPVYFEALLRVTTMAGSPDKFQVIAFRRITLP